MVVVSGFTVIITLFGRRLRFYNDCNPILVVVLTLTMIITHLVVVLGLTMIITLFGCRLRPHNDHNPTWLSF